MLDVADKVVATFLERTSVLAKPGSGKRLSFKDGVPIVHEHLDQPTLDASLLESIGSSPVNYCRLHC